MPGKIVVTGASGFIGGSISILLKLRGYEVVGIDRVTKPYLLEYFDSFIQSPFEDTLHSIKDADAVIHCAGTSLVGPSIKDPSEYYNNNVVNTIKLLDYIASESPNTTFFFSSSASVYKTKNAPLMEDDPLLPLSPYAKSKYMVEQVCEDYSRAYKLKYCIFRYFNACGAIGNKHGQEPNATHIFPRLFEEDIFTINGDDYDTSDGTCVRDYIHVREIAQAHLKAIEKGVQGIYNIGTGIGYSNKNIMDSVFKITGEKPVNVAPRREGDADSLIADPTLFKMIAGWTSMTGLQDIVHDLRQWYNSENFKRLKNVSTGNV